MPVGEGGERQDVGTILRGESTRAVVNVRSHIQPLRRVIYRVVLCEARQWR